jgi:polyphosphate kinase 2 (PPK2 family)
MLTCSKKKTRDITNTATTCVSCRSSSSDRARRSHIAVLFEGRDTAGKDGVIKHIVEHLSPRDTRVVALPPPSSRERTEWYFERYVAHLPAAAEFVLFNRSWYHRAGVERVMGFCTDAEVRCFFAAAPLFEHMLINDGMQLFKYYLDIDRCEQVQRLEERRSDPLAPWKISSIDSVAVNIGATIRSAATRCSGARTRRRRPGTLCARTTSRPRA